MSFRIGIHMFTQQVCVITVSLIMHGMSIMNIGKQTRAAQNRFATDCDETRSTNFVQHHKPVQPLCTVSRDLLIRPGTSFMPYLRVLGWTQRRWDSGAMLRAPTASSADLLVGAGLSADVLTVIVLTTRVFISGTRCTQSLRHLAMLAC